jgi:hypothetical protein
VGTRGEQVAEALHAAALGDLDQFGQAAQEPEHGALERRPRRAALPGRPPRALRDLFMSRTTSAAPLEAQSVRASSITRSLRT